MIEQTIDESTDMWDKTRYAEGFTLVTAEVMNTDLDESLSWWMFFLRSSITLCSDKAIQEKFKEVLKSLRKLDDSWRGEYINQELTELQFQLISLISMEQEVEKFLKENMDNPVMRERMIEPAMEQGDYEKVM